MKKTTLLIWAAAVAFPVWLGADVIVKPSENGWTVDVDGKRFTEYRHKDQPIPVLYPIIGPHGVEMTRHYPFKEGVANEASDHPHHRSLWFTHGDVNGVDFWHKGGTITQDKVLKAEGGDKQGVIQTRNRWVEKGGKEICADTRTIRFFETESGALGIDLTVTIEATNGDVVFGDTKEGSMAIRTHPALRLKGDVATGKAVNSSGDKGRDLWGKSAKWVSYWGQVDEKKVGVAIFGHPSNPRHPTTWHARDYGLIAANPFGYSYFNKGKEGKPQKGDLKVEDGHSVTFRYRFLFHEGSSTDLAPGKQFADFSSN
ncbi:MAG: PmoA family protein [Verrucomicrobiota bacterium]